MCPNGWWVYNNRKGVIANKKKVVPFFCLGILDLDLFLQLAAREMIHCIPGPGRIEGSHA